MLNPNYIQIKGWVVINMLDDKYVISIITVGSPDESPKPRPRKKHEDIVHYEKW